ncbi:hypothetical protein D5086_030578 [Populus alba]|uniref:Uncharacterized protein n=1 Tax=Populus alba TaxID=43335 RepID=A0ACC4ANW7_POPAL
MMERASCFMWWLVIGNHRNASILCSYLSNASSRVGNYTLDTGKILKSSGDVEGGGGVNRYVSKLDCKLKRKEVCEAN